MSGNQNRLRRLESARTTVEALEKAVMDPKRMLYRLLPPCWANPEIVARSFISIHQQLLQTTNRECRLYLIWGLSWTRVSLHDRLKARRLESKSTGLPESLVNEFQLAFAQIRPRLDAFQQWAETIVKLESQFQDRATLISTAPVD